MTLPDKMTIGECYNRCAEILTQEEADEYFAALVERDVRCFNKTQEEAISIQKQNIGYYSGYFDRTTAKRMLELFSCEHPIFGKNTEVTSGDALFSGVKLAVNGGRP